MVTDGSFSDDDKVFLKLLHGQAIEKPGKYMFCVNNECIMCACMGCICGFKILCSCSNF